MIDELDDCPEPWRSEIRRLEEDNKLLRKTLKSIRTTARLHGVAEAAINGIDMLALNALKHTENRE